MMKEKIKPNRQLIRQDFLGYWPIWVGSLLAFGMFSLLPMIFNMQAILHGDYVRNTEYSMSLEYANMSPAEIKNLLTDALMEPAQILSNSFVLAGITFLVALCVFGYLFKRKQAYMVHAFPMSRGSLFASHYLAGLLILAVPYVVLWASLWIAGAMASVPCGRMLGTGMYVSALFALFFYHLSILVMTLAANTFYAVSVYVGLNFLYGIWDYLMSTVQNMFCYGFSGESVVFNANSGWDQIFVPSVFFMAHNPLQHLNIRTDYRVCMQECSLFWIPSVLFLVLAFFCYRKRAVECAGDGMAFSWGAGVYRIVFTLTGGLVCAMPVFLVQSVINDPYEIKYLRSGTIMSFVGLAAGMVIAYFCVEMMLNKTFRIWKKTSYVRLLVLVLVGLGLLAGRNFKYGESSIPSAEQVDMVKVNVPYVDVNLYLDPHEYTDWLDLQKEMYRERTQYIRRNTIDKDTMFQMVYVTAKRKNGKVSRWQYTIPDNSKVLHNMQKLVEQKDGLERRLFAGELTEDVLADLNIALYSEMDDEMEGQTMTSIDRTKQEIIDAIRQDIEDGNLTTEQFRDLMTTERHYEIEMKIGHQKAGDNSFHRTITVDENCKNLLNVLERK